MADPLPIAVASRCPECGTELAAALLSCPGCHRLVHRDALNALAEEATCAERAGDPAAAQSAWRRALELLPPQSQQARQVAERLVALDTAPPAAEGTTVPVGPEPVKPSWSGWSRKGGALSGTALVLWKLKFAVLFVLTKAKLLLLGLTKAGTVLTMLLAFGVYWTAWGWRFALLFVLSMYVHEMGHVAALRHYGIAATAPMFVPGLGAFVRLKEYPKSALEDSRVGLAGPIWGLGAALACYGLFLATRTPVFAAAAQFAALINLFNLLPVWQLDGGRGFRSLSRVQRWAAVAAVGGAFALTREGLLALLAMAGIYQAWQGEAPDEGDAVGLVQYAGLALALSMLATLHVAVPGVP